MSARLGFVGLGVMGEPMAGHLLSAGHAVTVWNRSPGKSDRLKGLGATVVDTLPEVGAAADLIFLCVGRTEDVQECLAGMRNAAPRTLFVDHSTISPTGAASIESDLASRGHRFVDAPITGGSMGAKNGTLTVFGGGAEADIEEARPYISAFAKRLERVGGPGAGQMAKMANQIAVGGALMALCESLAFAKKAGLEIAQIRDLVSGGAGGSWAFQNYGAQILANDWTPGFSVKNQRKDFGYCREAASAIDAHLPGTTVVDALLAKLEEEGHGEWTTAALYEIMLRTHL